MVVYAAGTSQRLPSLKKLSTREVDRAERRASISGGASLGLQPLIKRAPAAPDNTRHTPVVRICPLLGASARTLRGSLALKVCRWRSSSGSVAKMTPLFAFPHN